MTGDINPVTAASVRTTPPLVPGKTKQQVAAPQPSGQPLPVKRPAIAPVDISKVVERLNDFVQDSQRSLRFRVDDLSGRTVITVFNDSTGEVVRQIPSAEVLALAEKLDQLAGSLVDATV
jgi:flagellar protein FlaG